MRNSKNDDPLGIVSVYHRERETFDHQPAQPRTFTRTQFRMGGWQLNRALDLRRKYVAQAQKPGFVMRKGRAKFRCGLLMK